MTHARLCHCPTLSLQDLAGEPDSSEGIDIYRLPGEGCRKKQRPGLVVAAAAQAGQGARPEALQQVPQAFESLLCCGQSEQEVRKHSQRLLRAVTPLNASAHATARRCHQYNSSGQTLALLCGHMSSVACSCSWVRPVLSPSDCWHAQGGEAHQPRPASQGWDPDFQVLLDSTPTPDVSAGEQPAVPQAPLAGGSVAAAAAAAAGSPQEHVRRSPTPELVPACRPRPEGLQGGFKLHGDTVFGSCSQSKQCLVVRSCQGVRL
jgi:hypothetical protein